MHALVTPSANPLASTEAATPSSTAADTAGQQVPPALDIQVGLTDGSLTAEQAIVMMERQLATQAAEIVQLRAMLTDPATTAFGTAVRSVIARLTEAPTNWQCALIDRRRQLEWQWLRTQPANGALACVLLSAANVQYILLRPIERRATQAEPSYFCLEVH
jgi:hypothetical protein